MNSKEIFDVIVIGGGQGAALARKLSEGGKRVAVIEKEAFGGSCVNHGCTPTKAHIAAAKRAHDARTARKLGIHVEDVRIDLKAVVARSNKLVNQFVHEIGERLQGSEKLEIINGVAKFTGAHSIEVSTSEGNRELGAEKIVIATGMRAEAPPIEGLDQIDHFDHASLLKLETLPEKLLILGGGYIACEFAQMFRRFGSEVTMAQKGSQLLGREDEDVSSAVAALLREENIEVHLNCEAKSIEKTADGLKCHFSDGSFKEATHLLVATGLKPNTDNLHLEAAEIELTEEGHIITDEFLNAAPGIWALGDVREGPAFTHIAYDDVRILAAHFLKNEKRSTHGRCIPYCVFVDPQLGRVGMTEKEACEAGYEVRVAKLPITETARGLESGEDEGFLKAVVDGKTGLILGGAFLCRDGGEVISVLQVAMEAGLPYTALRDGIFAHPTFAESLNNLFIAMDRHPVDSCFK